MCKSRDLDIGAPVADTTAMIRFIQSYFDALVSNTGIMPK
jgi:hypothetical protein